MAALKKALNEVEDKVDKERTEREKQELQDYVKKIESLERDSKTQESELAKAL